MKFTERLASWRIDARMAWRQIKLAPQEYRYWRRERDAAPLTAILLCVRDVWHAWRLPF